MTGKIIVGVSGGVDSSVTAMLLKQQGYDVEALFMKNWVDENEDGGCMWEADVEDALQVCEKLDIPLNTVDLSSNYWDRVFKNFLSEYKNGRTPNPDVLCNQEIKFNAFLEHAKALGAEKIATGHYSRIENNNNEYQLLKGLDQNKDQSYFLCRLTQEQLAQSMFPIGELPKPEVRKLAGQAHLITHDKKDSTGICFIGEQPFRQFLSRYIPPEKGYIKTTDGMIIGEHEGVFYYTLGQRQGLGIGGVKDASDLPWYVVQKRIDSNELIVAQDHDHPLLHSKQLTASNINWVSPKLPLEKLSCFAKTRYRQPDQACEVIRISENEYKVQFEQSQRAITPGQFVVFYQQDVCLGGGIIDSAE